MTADAVVGPSHTEVHASNAELHAWLDARVPAAPARLRERMDAAIADAGRDAPGGLPAANDSPSIPSALGEAALCALRTAVARGDDRAAALDLLAADALLTYMMEAAAEQGSDAIRGVADAYGNARLAQLVANTGPV